VPVIRLKARPVIGTLLNALGFPLLYLYANKKMGVIQIFFFLILVMLSWAAQVLHELSHEESDKIERIKTTVVGLGEKKAIATSKASLVLAITVSIFFTYSAKTFLLVTLPTMVFSAIFLIRTGKEPYKKTRISFKNKGLVTGIFYLLALT
jgi:4-hydroxybenzoate polyprenyltransferase